MRVFFLCEKGKSKVDGIIKQHGQFIDAGPLWLGQLWDSKLALNMFKSYKNDKDSDAGLLKFLNIVSDESKIETVGFYDLPSFVKKNGLKRIPKQELIVSAIRKKGYKVSLTHFKANCIRSNIPSKELIKLLKKV